MKLRDLLATFGNTAGQRRAAARKALTGFITANMKPDRYIRSGPTDTSPTSLFSRLSWSGRRGGTSSGCKHGGSIEVSPPWHQQLMLKTRVQPQMQEAGAMSSRELWDTVYGCAENGTVRPETMTNFFFEVLQQSLDEAQEVSRDGEYQRTTEKLRELQARCERLIQLFQPIEPKPSLRRVV